MPTTPIEETFVLHEAVKAGDLNKVNEILKKEPWRYAQQMPIDKYYKGAATPLDYALHHKQFDVSKLLLKHPDCQEIINLTNPSNGVTMLHLIARFPKIQALELAELALAINHININQTCFYNQTALSYACTQANIPLAKMLLEHGANPNLKNFDSFNYSINTVIFKVIECGNDISPSDINELILLLLDHNADPNIRNNLGENFFDFLTKTRNKRIYAMLNAQVINKLQNSWKISKAEEINKAKIIFDETVPLLFSRKEFQQLQSPSHKNAALLVQLKRERRKKSTLNNNDYDCTFLYGFKQFSAFLKLTQLRSRFEQVPFQTQFILQPKLTGIKQGHVVNGQLSFHESGGVNLFLVDTISDKPIRNEIKDRVHHYYPSAVLYTLDEKIQSTDSGCHIFALYISEQLSSAYYKNKDLYADLSRICQTKKDGFYIVPGETSPGYTGVFRIIQSAKKPMARLDKNLPEDRLPINKAGQSYRTIMQTMITKGKFSSNTTYDKKRNKYAVYLTEALEKFYGTPELSKKIFAGSTDIVNRLGANLLIKFAEEAGIRVEGTKDKWAISMPEEYQCAFLRSQSLQGTLEELSIILEDAKTSLCSDDSVFNECDILLQYAAILSTSHILSVAIKQNMQPKIIEEENSVQHSFALKC